MAHVVFGLFVYAQNMHQTDMEILKVTFYEDLYTL